MGAHRIPRTMGSRSPEAIAPYPIYARCRRATALSAVHLLLRLRCRRFRLKRPPNGRLTNAIDFGQLCHCLALGIALGSSADHFLIQFALATERDALGL